jgi:hypothetical protein
MYCYSSLALLLVWVRKVYYLQFFGAVVDFIVKVGATF